MQVSGQRPGRTSGPPYRVPPRLRRGGCTWPREDHCDRRPGPRRARRIHRAACPFLVGPGSRGGVAELLSPLGRAAEISASPAARLVALVRDAAVPAGRPRTHPAAAAPDHAACRDLPWTCGGPGMYLAIGHRCWPVSGQRSNIGVTCALPPPMSGDAESLAWGPGHRASRAPGRWPGSDEPGRQDGG